MPDNKIKIRVAELGDCKSVYDWRVDTQSAACLVPCSLRQWKSTGCGLRIH